jgi:hypothetical protein
MSSDLILPRAVPSYGFRGLGHVSGYRCGRCEKQMQPHGWKWGHYRGARLRIGACCQASLPIGVAA